MQEVPLLPWWFTVGLAVWAAVGPLAGIMIGHYLTRSWQRKQWLADSKLKEWSNLLVILTSSFTRIARLGVEERTPEVFKNIAEARLEGLSAIAGKVFIGKKLVKNNTFILFNESVTRFLEHGDVSAFGVEFDKISHAIRDWAEEDANNA